MIQWLYLVGLLAGITGCTGFALQYAARTRGWYQTWPGRLIMAIVLVLDGLFALSATAYVALVWPSTADVIGTVWPPLYVGGLYSLDMVIYGLWVLLNIEQRRQPPGGSSPPDVPQEEQ